MIAVTGDFRNVDSNGLILQLRHVSESYGYEITIRRSMYHDSLRQIVKNVTIVCKNAGDGCMFRCRLRGYMHTREDRSHSAAYNSSSSSQEKSEKRVTKRVVHVLNFIEFMSGC